MPPRRRQRFLSLSLLEILVSLPAMADDAAFLDRLEHLRAEAQIPGLAVAVLVDGEVVLTEAVGLADIESGRVMTTSTVLNIGSVSKLVTSTAVLQLWEEGALDLDADVARYLPFELRHPAGGTITVRQLLTHTSGIQDGPSYGASYACGDPAVSLADWLEGYLVPGGPYYSADNFLPSPPGTAFEYSNVGYGLLGLVAERVAGRDFTALTRERIFTPLGMESTGWRLDSIDLARHATPYWVPRPESEPDPEDLALLTRDPEPGGDPVPFCLYSFYNYPDGLVRTTIEDLARFVAATLPGPSRAEPLLSEATRAEVFRNQLGEIETDGRFQGLGWRRTEAAGLGVLWGHGGADPGIRAHVLHRAADGVTVVAMTNTLVGDALRPLLELLFEEGARIAAGGRPGAPFALRSDPWVNLHHFLYHEARNTLLGDERLSGRVRTYPEDREVELDGAEAEVWGAALEVYASYGEQHLIFDAELHEIGNTVTLGPDALPDGPEAAPAFRALRSAMPIYLERWWPRHDATNRARIEELSGYLARYGDALASRVASSYGVDWPAEPILVDVTNYSGRHGAYATGDPNHIVLASGQDWFPGLLALDVLFHEAGHTLPFEDQVLPRSQAAARAAGVEEGDVWHAFLFFVPSEAAREVLPPSHTSYAYLDDGPLVAGRMSLAEPYIRAALEQTDDLDEAFRLIHEARAAEDGD